MTAAWKPSRGGILKGRPTCLQPSSSLPSFCPPLFCLCPRRLSSFLRPFSLPPYPFLVRRPALTCCPGRQWLTRVPTPSSSLILLVVSIAHLMAFSHQYAVKIPSYRIDIEGPITALYFMR